MSRGAWKTNGLSVKKSSDFGELTITLVENYKRTKYVAYGEFTVHCECTGVTLLLAVIVLTAETCAIYDIEKRTLLTKYALTIPARDVTPRNLAFVLTSATAGT
jgi:hypothetical protein